MKLLHLFASMSSPSFLLANETNYTLLQSLLESINAIIEHQYTSKRRSLSHSSETTLTLTEGNSTLVQAIIKCQKRFEALRSFTLESGQEEIELLKQPKKDAENSSENAHSPARRSRNSSMESVRSPHVSRTPTLSNVPEEGGAFAIGDDEDSEDENQEILPTPSQSSPSNHNSRTPSVSSSIDEPLPTQLRGMSEKARGKMPAGQSSFSRQNSTTSLTTHPATIMSPNPGFDPTAHWGRAPFPSLPPRPY